MRMTLIGLLAAVGGLLAAPVSGVTAEGALAGRLSRAVHELAPAAAAVPGGWRFRVQEVVVSVLADEASGLLRVIARAGELSDHEVGLVAAALGPDLPSDPAARVVSVRGLLCSAVLAPLRGVTDGVLRRAVEGAVRVAREAVLPPEPFAAPSAEPRPIARGRALEVDGEADGSAVR